jgi:hypothetical protein
MAYRDYQFTWPILGDRRTVCILGTANLGPIREIVSGSSPKQVEAIFGTNGTLYSWFKAAWEQEPSNQYLLIRVSGDHAEAQVLCGDENFILFRSIKGGFTGNDIQVSVGFIDTITPEGEPTQRRALVITENRSDAETRINTYFLDNFPTCESLIHRVNSDAYAGFAPVLMSGDLDLQDISVIPDFNVPLSGGTDGVNATKNELHTYLTEVYDLLLGRGIDVVCPAGVYFDDVRISSYYGEDTYGEAYYSPEGDYLTLTDEDGNPLTFHGQLADFCLAQQEFGIMTLGVMGMRPIESLDQLKQYEYSYLLAIARNTPFADRYHFEEVNNGLKIDKGLFLNIVCADCLDSDNNLVSGAAAYASILACTPIGQTTTNQVIRSAVAQRFEFSSDIQKEFSDLGIVTFRTSPKRGLTVVNGVTAALLPSEYHFVLSTRTVQEVSYNVNQIIRDAKKTFTGRGNRSSYILNARQILQDRISSYLISLQEENLIRGYRCEVTIDGARLMAKVDIVPLQSVEFLGGTAVLDLV